MHPNVRQAIEEIDSALFSGDTFYNEEDRILLVQFLNRWRNAVDEINTEMVKGATPDDSFEAHDEADREPPDTDDADAPTMAIDGFQLGGGIPPGKLVMLGGKSTRTFPFEPNGNFQDGNGNFLDECNYGAQELT